MFEKRLLALCFLAIIVGIASIAPLPFLMFEKTQALESDKPQFNIDISYVYIGDYWNNNSVTANQSYGWVYGLVFKTDPYFNFITMDADAVFEYYTIEISTENGIIGNVTLASHASRPNFDPKTLFKYSTLPPDQWFAVNTSRSSGHYGLYPNGTGLGTINGPGDDWNRTAGEPETLTVTLRRIGWVILNNNFTVSHMASSDVVFQIQLEKYRDGFIYNNLFTQEQLSQINPAMPQFKLYSLLGGHPVNEG